MKKLSMALILLTLTMPSHAMNFTKKDLVGDWICKIEDKDVTQRELMRYHADGTADEYIEYQYKSLYAPTLEVFSLHYHWRLKGDTMHMDEIALVSYDLYDFFNGGLVKVDDEEWLNFSKNSTLQSLIENNSNNIAFDDKDHHRFYVDGEFAGQCHRLK